MKSLVLFIMLMAVDFGIVSFNCRGIDSSRNEVKELCKSHKIVCLQEHWLPKQELSDLNNICNDFSSFGSSPMDLTNGIMLGRPYGGVGVLWHNS